MLFFLKITRQTEDTLNSCVLGLILHSHLNVIENAHSLEQADILERSRNAALVYLYGWLSRDVRAVEEYTARSGFIHTRQHIEHGSLACAVRSDKSVKLSLIDTHIQTVDRAKSAELNGKLFNFQHRSIFLAHLFGTSRFLFLEYRFELPNGSGRADTLSELNKERRVVEDHHTDKHDSVNQHTIISDLAE